MSISLSPADKKKLLGNLDEISNAMTRISAEKDLLKEIYEKMQEDFEIPKKVGRKLGKAYFKRDIETQVAETNEVSDLYDSIMVSTPIQP